MMKTALLLALATLAHSANLGLDRQVRQAPVDGASDPTTTTSISPPTAMQLLQAMMANAASQGDRATSQDTTSTSQGAGGAIGIGSILDILTGGLQTFINFPNQLSVLSNVAPSTGVQTGDTNVGLGPITVIIQSIITSLLGLLQLPVPTSAGRLTMPAQHRNVRQTGIEAEGQDGGQEVIADLALADIGLLSLTEFTGHLFKSLIEVSAAVDCQFEAIRCEMAAKGDQELVGKCSQAFADCVKPPMPLVSN
ncbi:hypothetical protein HDE_09581 [Halotydeus destructor]|nr:hypothetical protein HDE_09581 [Halotydeus destructor]